VINQDRTLNSAANPAAKDSVINFLRHWRGATPICQVWTVSWPQYLSLHLVLPVIVAIANISAGGTVCRATRGLVSGFLQISVRILIDASRGPRVPVVIRIGDVFSQPSVIVSIP
jgi:uncharacterized protein (TIGR03437 family)